MDKSRMFALALFTSVFALSGAHAHEAALELPAGKGAWVNVHFKASPESTPGKSLLAELLVTDTKGEMPIESIEIEASPFFTEDSPVIRLPRRHATQFKNQKGTVPVYVPADAEALVLEAILFGVADRKLVLNYGVTGAEVSDATDAKAVDQKIEVDHATRAANQQIRIPIVRVESGS
jgi:hypothetical protein